MTTRTPPTRRAAEAAAPLNRFVSPGGQTLNRLALNLLTALLLASTPAASVEVEVRPDERTPYYTFSSYRSVGDRGEVRLDVDVRDEPCTEQWRFHAAEIQIRESRFGDAQFAALPVAGCADCSEIVVRWMHEPTGFLEFDVNVLRERHLNPCDKELP